MEPLVKDHPLELLGVRKPPCLSLYQRTHRRNPENQQAPIRFRILLKALEQSLRQKYVTREVTPLLDPFRSLADDADFWHHTLDGLAFDRTNRSFVTSVGSRVGYLGRRQSRLQRPCGNSARGSVPRHGSKCRERADARGVERSPRLGPRLDDIDVNRDGIMTRKALRGHI